MVNYVTLPCNRRRALALAKPVVVAAKPKIIVAARANPSPVIDRDSRSTPRGRTRVVYARSDVNGFDAEASSATTALDIPSW